MCKIASKLARQMLSMELLTGRGLVMEATSLYMKERPALINKSIERKRRIQQIRSRPTSLFVVHHEKYDAAANQVDGEDRRIQQIVVSLQAFLLFTTKSTIDVLNK